MVDYQYLFLTKKPFRIISNDNDSVTYGKFSDIFPDRKYEAHLLRLQNALDLLEIPKEYPSIIDLDMYLFGLIYQIVFKNKTIDVTKKNDIKKELNNEIIKFKDIYSHKRAPNNLGNLRRRITKSVYIYEKYTFHES